MDKSRPVKVKTMIRLNRFEDIFIKSIVYFLQFFEDSSLKADQKCVEDYIFERIDSDGKLMDAIHYNLDCLYNIGVLGKVRPDRKNINTMENKGNLIGVHIALDKIERDMKQLAMSENRIQSMDLIFWDCILVNSRISSILINYVFESGDDLDYDAHFMPNLMIQEYALTLKQRAALKESIREYYGEDERIKWCETLLYRMDARTLEMGIDFMKVQTVLLTIAESPFYGKQVRKIARDILAVFKEVLVNCRVFKVIMEPDMELRESGSGFKDSTKMEIFFMLENDDRFCLRLDFPHKGVDYIHYNLHEPGNTTGLPLGSESIRKFIGICGSLDNFKKLFFVYESQCWFRWNFLEKLYDVFEKGSEQLTELEKVFRKQCHCKIIGEDIEVADVRKFMKCFAEGLNYMNMSQYFSGKTNHVNIDDILNRMKIESIVYEALTIYYTVGFERLMYGKPYDDIVKKLRERVFEAVKKFSDSRTWIRLAEAGIEAMTFEAMMDKITEGLFDAAFVETL